MADQPTYTRKQGDQVFRPHRYTRNTWRIAVPSVSNTRLGPSSSFILVYGFLIVIALGGILLSLPISSNTGQSTGIIDSLFTATSATCVTGLVVFDTANHWSGFGQAVIAFLIQVGGFGFMTSATLFMITFGRRIGIRERLLISESMGLNKTGGLLALLIRMAIFTLTAEMIGAVIFFIQFSSEMNAGKAIWSSLFQTISAFNNAGFDLSGGFRSLTIYNTSPLIVITTAMLIILGGISYLVVSDILQKRRWTNFSLDSKIVISTTLGLLVVGTIIFLITESGDPETFGAMSFPVKLMNAFFQSVTARTAGFNTVDMADLADYALFATMLLMFVGGASGSTAGGVKVNTFGMIIATITSTIRGREHTEAFGRELTASQIYRALAVIFVSLTVISVVVLLLTVTEPFRFLNLLFETISAFGTVGLSTGITPELTIPGRIIIMITMFIGRIGPLALILALIRRQQTTSFRYPKETIRIG